METLTQWRGAPDTSRRRFWGIVVVSLLIHVPLTPVAAFLGLLTLLLHSGPTQEAVEVEALEAIPIDLLESADEPTPAQEKATGEGKTQGADEKTAEEKKDEKNPFELDDPSGGKKQEQAKAGDAGTNPGGAIGDPVALAGAAGKIADANANVRVIVFADRIRNHPMGKRVGELLGQADQWKDFFGPGGIDPINDVDRILVAGPQFRDSSQVVAVIRTNISDDKVKTALGELVKNDEQGSWIDAGVPAARARADRAERIFVMPAPHMVVVAPPSVEKQALSLGSKLTFPNPQGSEALTAYVVSPWRALVGVPFKIPESIKWVRLKVTATSDGGATAEVLAEDESPEVAEKNATLLTDALNAATHKNLGAIGAIFGKKELVLLEPVKFTSDGNKIKGTITATPKQLRALLEAVAAYAKQVAEEQAKKAAAKKAAAAAEAGTPAPAANAPDASAPAKANQEDKPQNQKEETPSSPAKPAPAPLQKQE